MSGRDEYSFPNTRAKHARSAADEANIAAEWARLTPEEREARDRIMLLTFLGGLQMIADHEIISLAGRDCPMVHGGPGREREVVADSSLSFFRGIKDECVEMARATRNNNPLPW